MNKTFGLAVLVFLLSIITANAAPYIFMEDNWAMHTTTNTDNVIFVHRSFFPEVRGVSDDKADMICYDWNDDGNYDNCYWDNNDGCGSSGCSASSCDNFPEPSSVSASKKRGCEIDKNGGCVIGSTVSPGTMCDGCSGVNTINSASGKVAAKVYYECDTGGEHDETLSKLSYKIIFAARYRCVISQYSLQGGIYWFGNWLDIKTGLTCTSGSYCSNTLFDEIVYKPDDNLNPPCGVANWGNCSATKPCAFAECINGICIPCNKYQCAHVPDKECVYENDIYANQFYCGYDHVFDVCNATINEPCKEHNGFYCTKNQSNDWQYRFCNYGCKEDTEACITNVPLIGISPANFTYKV